MGLAAAVDDPRWRSKRLMVMTRKKPFKSTRKTQKRDRVGVEHRTSGEICVSVAPLSGQRREGRRLRHSCEWA